MLGKRLKTNAAGGIKPAYRREQPEGAFLDQILTVSACKEGMLGLIKAMREYDPNQNASFCTFAEICIRRRLYSVLKSASSGKHQPLNQAIPLNPSFFDVSLAFAQVDPEVLLIDREKTAGLLEYACKQLSAFEAEILGYYLDGLTCREIAETVGKPPKSVENAVQRIRRKIGRQLQSGDISKG